MTLNTWWLFCVAVFLLSGTPGPNMLHVLSRSIRFGVRRSLATMAGCMSALVLVLMASAGGLSALLLAAPAVFDVVRYLGVAYLIYLGIRAWRGDDAPFDVGTGALTAQMSGWALFRGGFVIGISNPKLLLFAAAFLPQFVNHGQPQAQQYAILIATFAAVEAFWYLAYAFGGRKLALHLTRPALKRAFNRLTGGIFAGFGLALLRVRP